jgi:hypothetical protein
MDKHDATGLQVKDLDVYEAVRQAALPLVEV